MAHDADIVDVDTTREEAAQIFRRVFDFKSDTAFDLGRVEVFHLGDHAGNVLNTLVEKIGHQLPGPKRAFGRWGQERRVGQIAERRRFVVLIKKAEEVPEHRAERISGAQPVGRINLFLRFAGGPKRSRVVEHRRRRAFGRQSNRHHDVTLCRQIFGRAGPSVNGTAQTMNHDHQRETAVGDRRPFVSLINALDQIPLKGVLRKSLVALKDVRYRNLGSFGSCRQRAGKQSFASARGHAIRHGGRIVDVGHRRARRAAGVDIVEPGFVFLGLVLAAPGVEGLAEVAHEIRRHADGEFGLRF